MVDHLAVNLPGLLQCSPDVATRQVYIYESIATMPDNRNTRRVQRSHFAGVLEHVWKARFWVFRIFGICGCLDVGQIAGELMARRPLAGSSGETSPHAVPYNKLKGSRCERPADLSARDRHREHHRPAARVRCALAGRV